MPVEHIDVLMKGTAILAAIIAGAMAPDYKSAAGRAWGVWAGLMVAYVVAISRWAELFTSQYTLTGMAAVGIGLGLGLMLWALFAHWVGRFFRHRSA